MKVDLEKIRLAVTAITNSVVATIPNKDGKTMRCKHDVTSDFLKCIVEYGKNTRFNIDTDDENKGTDVYQVVVVPLKNHKTEILTRKEVITLLKEFRKDEAKSRKDNGCTLDVDNWAIDNLK